MKRQVIYILTIWLFSLFYPISQGFSGDLAKITGYHINDNSDNTEFLLDLSTHRPYHILTLSDPERIVIDLTNTAWTGNLTPPNSQSRVTNLRKSVKKENDLRLVLDLNQPIIVYEHAILFPDDAHPNYRLLLRFKPKNPLLDQIATKPDFIPQTVFKSTSQSDPESILSPTISDPLPTGVPAPIFKPTIAYKPMIIIDAGHGGHDPGSLGRRKTKEKVVTLAYSKSLRDALLKTNRYRVFMTRDRDVFVALRDRVKLAEKAKGDLFIALHADSHPNKQTRGLSVYTLSETASDREAAIIARNANSSGNIGQIEIDDIRQDEITSLLIDLVQRDTKNLSSSFAETLVGQLQQQVTLLRNTHRFAGFRVLTSPSMPSVLIELGYLSNRQEEALLLSSKYKEKLVSAIVKAIDIHFATYPRR